MHTLPPAMILLLRPFAPHFSCRVWAHVQVLLAGAILAPAQRTVTAALRVMGLGACPRFQRYHRVLNRDRWSSLAVSRVLLGLLVSTFAASGSLVIGVDETLERRRGAKIAAKGMYRDAVRSSHSHFVKASGLRWICLMLRVPIPWADRVWALPFLTALAPSERANAAAGRQHKTPTDWARPLVRVVRRWYPERVIVAVADSGYAALSLLASCTALSMPVTMITRSRLDAALYTPAPPRQPKQNGRPRVKGARLPTLAAVATDPATNWLCVTLAHGYGQGEAGLHWLRTPPSGTTPAWYRKRAPTFSDTLARVRREIWAYEALCLSGAQAEMVKVPRILVERLTDTLCSVA